MTLFFFERELVEANRHPGAEKKFLKGVDNHNVLCYTMYTR